MLSSQNMLYLFRSFVLNGSPYIHSFILIKNGSRDQAEESSKHIENQEQSGTLVLMEQFESLEPELKDYKNDPNAFKIENIHSKLEVFKTPQDNNPENMTADFEYRIVINACLDARIQDDSSNIDSAHRIKNPFSSNITCLTLLNIILLLIFLAGKVGSELIIMRILYYVLLKCIVGTSHHILSPLALLYSYVELRNAAKVVFMRGGTVQNKSKEMALSELKKELGIISRDS